jgi:hypothetical protein
VDFAPEELKAAPIWKFIPLDTREHRWRFREMRHLGLVRV